MNDFGIWTGGLTYPKEGVALLVAVVTGGFHPVSSYLWSVNGMRLVEEKFPLMYTTMRGEYVCEIRTNNSDVQVAHKFTFIVGGISIYGIMLICITVVCVCVCVFQGSDEDWSMSDPPPYGPSQTLKMKAQPIEMDTPMEIGGKGEQVMESNAGE